MSFAKILAHPDKAEIISRIISGQSVRDIAEWLKLRYPDDPDKQLSANNLNDFRKKHLNIQGADINELKDQTKALKQELENEEIKQLVKQNPTYKERMQEIKSAEVDWKLKLVQLANVLESRAETIYNRQLANPDNTKLDYAFVQYMDRVLKIAEDIKKLEGAPDQIIQHNVTIQTVETYTNVIQEALRQTLAEIDTETANLFMEKYQENLAKLKPGSSLSKPSSIEEIGLKIDKLLPQVKVTTSAEEISAEDNDDDDDDEKNNE